MTDPTRWIELVGAALALIGSGVMAAAIIGSRRAGAAIPGELAGRWRLMTSLIAASLAGYLAFAAIVALEIAIPAEILAGVVFLGGAIVVFAVMDLTGRTIGRLRTSEAELLALTETLEARVAERSRASERRALQLQTTAEIARVAAQSTDPTPLMIRAVELIRANFGFYHASIFGLDETGGWAVLRASTGEAGRALLSRGHRLAIGSASMVGWTTGNRLPRVSNDVSTDAFHLANPLLPDTRAELALPMIVGGSLIGALDVQSTEVNAFSEEDVRGLEAIAGELAIAIENARLVRETEQELDATEGLFRGRARQSWARFAQSGIPTMFRLGAGEQMFRDESHELAQQALKAAATARSDDGIEIAVPVVVRGEAIATIAARRPDGADAWSDEDIALVEAAASQVGLALESARQYSEEQRRVAELEVVNRVSQAVSQLLAWTRCTGWCTLR